MQAKADDMQAFQAGAYYRPDAGPAGEAAGMPARLPPFPATVRVGRGGGLMSHLSVWKNLLLPLEYRGRDIRHAAEDAALLFALCGEDEARLPRLMASYPDDLSLYEKRLVGFVRALLLEPEALVLEGICDGLPVAERERAAQWPAVFRLRFPFRTLLDEAGCAA